METYLVYCFFIIIILFYSISHCRFFEFFNWTTMFVTVHRFFGDPWMVNIYIARFLQIIVANIVLFLFMQYV